MIFDECWSVVLAGEFVFLLLYVIYHEYCNIKFVQSLALGDSIKSED